MYKCILVPVDLADTELAKPAIATAVAMAKASGGSVRLVNVLPMTPVMLAEYVPPDFDVQQRKSSEEALGIIAKECGLDAAHAGASQSHRRRLDRDEFAPPSHAYIFPRLQCRARRALCQMFGAGGA
jgi:nucleotide-binding universal stress UspA family protein